MPHVERVYQGSQPCMGTNYNTNNMKATISTNTLKQEKRGATVSLNFAISQGYDTKFNQAYRTALDNIRFEYELDELKSYKRIYWNAFHKKDTSVMNGALEQLKVEFNIQG